MGGVCAFAAACLAASARAGQSPPLPPAARVQAGLTQKISLIQGPPGTGKTYLGVQLMRVLRSMLEARRSALKNEPPILVVCFTNHALDQFLEGLLDAGITNIIRVGGR